MNEDSIFDDLKLLPKEVKPIYRFVGIVRLLMIITLISASAALLVLYSSTFYFNVNAGNSAGVTWKTAALVLIPLIIYGLMLMYYIPQVKYELGLSPKLFAKRRFRLFSIILNILFVIATLTSMGVNRWHISGSSASGVVMYSMLVLFLSIIIIDIKLFSTQGRIN